MQLRHCLYLALHSNTSKHVLLAELVDFAATQGITKDGEDGMLSARIQYRLCKAACVVLKPDNVLVAGTAWLRNTAPFKNRKGTDY